MSRLKVADLLGEERWSNVEGYTDIAPHHLRYRTAASGELDTDGYDHVIRAVWIYGHCNFGVMPKTSDHEQMAEFEDQLRESVESDSMAILTAVLTHNCMRRWILYTGDTQESIARVNALPQYRSVHPLQLLSDYDPDWAYLRDKILVLAPKE